MCHDAFLVLQCVLALQILHGFIRVSAIIVQIEAYKDMIAPVVDAFKYLTQVSIDNCAKQDIILLYIMNMF